MAGRGVPPGTGKEGLTVTDLEREIAALRSRIARCEARLEEITSLPPFVLALRL